MWLQFHPPCPPRSARGERVSSRSLFRRHSISQACLLIALAGLACERDPDPTPPPSTVKLETVPSDLLLEGSVVVFGVRMPVNSELRGQHVSAATVRVAHPMEKVSTYLRAHLEASSVETGPQKTVFLGAKRKGGSPADPSLKIVVSRGGLGTDLIVQVEPKPAVGPSNPRIVIERDGTGGADGDASPVPPEVAAKMPPEVAAKLQTARPTTSAAPPPQ